jgi:hypothetical protein
MSTHHVSRIRIAAIAATVSATVGMLSAAGADAPALPTEGARTVQQSNHAVAACKIIERPKHVIRRCECTPGAASRVASIDAAEILRLLTMDQGCRGATVPRD